MAYESISAYIEKIETLLTEDLSPQAIARELGIPEKWRTIHRYKKEVFDFKRAASDEWTEEKQKGHEERFKRGKERIVDNFEFLNKLKVKADKLLDFKVGDIYETTEGIKHKISPHKLSEIYGKAAQIGTSAIKAELELSGDDPESRKANTLLELIKSVSDDEEEGGS